MTDSALPEGVLKPADDVIRTEVEDEVLLLATESSRYIGLTGVATRIWELIEEGAHDAGQIADMLCDEFDAEPAMIRADLAKTLADLMAHRLITNG